MDAIDFWATIAQVRTMADGGLRLVLDLPEDAVDVAAWMMEAKRLGLMLKVVVEPDSR